jgi:hypothetical protein
LKRSSPKSLGSAQLGSGLMFAGSFHLAPALGVAGGHTLPFKKGHGLPILK